MDEPLKYEEGEDEFVISEDEMSEIHKELVSAIPYMKFQFHTGFDEGAVIEGTYFGEKRLVVMQNLVQDEDEIPMMDWMKYLVAASKSNQDGDCGVKMDRDSLEDEAWDYFVENIEDPDSKKLRLSCE